MSFIFREKKKPVIGIDISSTAVKVLELSRSGDRYKVESFGYEPLPTGAIDEYVIKDHELVAKTIRKVVSAAKPKVRTAALSLPGSMVITKLVEMDATMFDFEIENQLMMEAEQYIPFSMDEVNMDFDVLGPNAEDETKNDVLLAVSQTERVDDLIGVSRAAKVSPLVVDVEAYAIERAFNVVFPESEEQRIALVDIGAMSTTLYVYENGQLIYIRDQFFGSNQLTEEIQRRYSLSSVEAEEAKQSGKLPQGYFKNVLEPFKEVLVQQIERSLQFFYSSNANAQIDRCFLCGGGANLENLAQETQNQINVTTELLDPTANIDISSKAEKQGFEDYAKQMMTAIGLAMRSY